MGLTELKMWQFYCDDCGKRPKVVTDSFSPECPRGWKKFHVGPCGLTDYYKDILVCPKCAKKREKK